MSSWYDTYWPPVICFQVTHYVVYMVVVPADDFMVNDCEVGKTLSQSTVETKAEANTYSLDLATLNETSNSQVKPGRS